MYILVLIRRTSTHKPLLEVEPCAGRAAADNLWAPPPTFGHRPAATDDIHKLMRKFFTTERNFFRDSMKKIVGHPRRASPPTFLTGGSPPPPTKALTRRQERII